MRDYTADNITEAVVKEYASKTQDPRMKRIITSLIEHMHAFVKEVELTEAEWFAGIQFLTATGKMCDDKRQEFILLSDTLGVSMLVDTLNHPKTGLGTESTVLGPFYVEDAPEQKKRHLRYPQRCRRAANAHEGKGHGRRGGTDCRCDG